MARDRASRPEAKPLRLFVAVDVPDSVRTAIQEAIVPLRKRFPKARWVPMENQHVTVKFLGSTWPRLVEWVRETVGSVAERHGAFETRLTGLGAFPNVRRSRVLWAGLDDPASTMAGIVADLDEALEREFKPEQRAFTPHLTVARFEPPVPLGELVQDIDVDQEPFDVDRLVIYRSHLRRPAPVYEPLDTFSLGGLPDA
jgi:RNA 2',3'-cyclic 3'-phosphodiesterase